MFYRNYKPTKKTIKKTNEFYKTLLLPNHYVKYHFKCSGITSIHICYTDKQNQEKKYTRIKEYVYDSLFRKYLTTYEETYYIKYLHLTKKKYQEFKKKYEDVLKDGNNRNIRISKNK